MCGIAGFIGQKNNSDIGHLQSMLRSQVHRGPDAEGTIFETVGDYQIALGHRRLSIIDTSELANQPMIYDNLTIVYNGEVYNFAEIKIELQAAGYTFISEGDTEVVLKAFHQWGVESVNKFRGMFSFCIYDKNTKKAYLFRDRVGVKPFYYSHVDHNLIFSSETKSFHHHPKFKNTICQHGLNLYFQYGYIPAPWTIFSGIKKIRPGYFVEYDLVKNTLAENKYWDMSSYYLLPRAKLDMHEATEELHDILSESFSLRMVSDVPVGVLLSGGIDSSLVASILQSNASKPIDTFTMGFDNKSLDESEHARKIAKHLGTHHHEQMCTWKDADEMISHLPTMYDEPFADSSAIPTALISKFAKQKVSVVLSGDGGDEMFCGYSAYALSDKRFHKINKIPFKKGVSKILDFVPDPMMSLYRANYDLYTRYLKFKSLFSHENIEDKYRSITRTFTSYDITKLILNNQSVSIHSAILPEVNTLERMMLVDFNHYLPDDIMVKVDRATMYYSLEGREPLLDHKILEFAAQLPIEIKLNKLILKNILAKYLPVSYFDRKKHGFGVPVNAWLKKELRYLLDKYLNKVKIQQQGIFNHHYISKLCQSFLHSNTNDNRIWTLLTFQMWHEKYFGESF